MTSKDEIDKVLHDPVSPAVLSAIRHSPLQESEQASLCAALQSTFELNADWEKNFQRTEGQNFNPRPSRLCQIYLEMNPAPSLYEAFLLLSLCLPDQSTAKKFLSSLPISVPDSYTSCWTWCQDGNISDLRIFAEHGSVLGVFALDEIRHLHLDARAKNILQQRLFLADTLAKRLPDGKLRTLLSHAVERAKRVGNRTDADSHSKH